MRRKLIVVWDRLGAHRKAAHLLRESHLGWFDFEFLPAYAPELNPVEQLWNHTKYSELANVIPQDVGDLRDLVECTIDENRRRKHLLKPFVRRLRTAESVRHSFRRAGLNNLRGAGAGKTWDLVLTMCPLEAVSGALRRATSRSPCGPAPRTLTKPPRMSGFRHAADRRCSPTVDASPRAAAGDNRQANDRTKLVRSPSGLARFYACEAACDRRHPPARRAGLARERCRRVRPL